MRAALGVPLARLFDYAVPDGVAIAVGDRVVVPFGTRQRIGVVMQTDARSELPAARLKSVLAIREDAPRLSSEWLELMRFLASYYQRPIGECVIGALPPRLRSVKPLPRKAGAALSGNPAGKTEGKLKQGKGQARKKKGHLRDLFGR